MRFRRLGPLLLLVVLAIPAAGRAVPLPAGPPGARAPRATATPPAVAPRATPAPSLAVAPPDVSAPGLWWFAPHGPALAAGKAAGPGIWRRAAPGEAWSWAALPDEAITVRRYAGTATPPQPAWPEDYTRVQAERIVGPAGDELGYWVWNAGFFVQLPSGSHRWDPHWQWAPAGQPALLLPEQPPYEPDGPVYWTKASAQPLPVAG